MCRTFVFHLALLTIAAATAPHFSFAQQSERTLAKGVLKTIPPSQRPDETFSGPRDFTEIVKGIPNLDWDPNFLAKTETLLAKSEGVVFRRRVWCLEFSFKTMRMIDVDVPQPDGTMDRKQVWYLLYRIRNLGSHLQPTPQEDAFGSKTYTVEKVDFPCRFFPEFILRSHDYDKEYSDQVIPSALRPIKQREKISHQLYNSIQIMSQPLPVSQEGDDHSIWGVATWTDVDPRIDYFSVIVRGLTNAYKWVDPEGAFEPGDKPLEGRQYQHKMLQLNFYRPGDTEFEKESEFHYGVPTFGDAEALPKKWAIYGQREPLDHRWIYR